MATSFPQFGSLPTELRLKIWRLALPAVEHDYMVLPVTHLWEEDLAAMGSEHFTCVYKPAMRPGALFVNHESRQVAASWAKENAIRLDQCGESRKPLCVQMWYSQPTYISPEGIIYSIHEWWRYLREECILCDIREIIIPVSTAWSWYKELANVLNKLDEPPTVLIAWGKLPERSGGKDPWLRLIPRMKPRPDGPRQAARPQWRWKIERAIEGTMKMNFSDRIEASDLPQQAVDVRETMDLIRRRMVESNLSGSEGDSPGYDLIPVKLVEVQGS